MQIRTITRPRCMICGSSGQLLHENLRDVLYEAPGNWRLSQCANSNCNLAWLDPAAVDSDIPLLYSKYYTHAENGPLSGLQELQRAGRAFLVGVYGVCKLIPLLMMGSIQEKNRLANMFLHDLPPGSVLDIGCGAGDFLNRMRRQGWSVSGLDFDPVAIANAKIKYGLELIQGDLAGARLPDNSFDAVTMNHVIEHVTDPLALLIEVRRVLKPGGRLVLVTPNIESMGHSMFGPSWRGLEPPRHMQIFSLGALSACGHQALFKRVEVKSTAVNADFMLEASFGIREANQRGGISRPASEINILRTLRCVIIQIWELFRLRKHPNCGEEAVLICQK